MPYKILILGDANIVRFWDASQVARPQLLGVSLKPVSCFDTLTSALSIITDETDLVLLSFLTSFLLEEASAVEVRSTCTTIITDVVKRLVPVAKKSSKVEVRS